MQTYTLVFLCLNVVMEPDMMSPVRISVMKIAISFQRSSAVLGQPLVTYKILFPPLLLLISLPSLSCSLWINLGLKYQNSVEMFSGYLCAHLYTVGPGPFPCIKVFYFWRKCPC